MAIAALACVGYGSIFLMMGLVYRNPMVPAAVIMVWEGINGFLPPLLKKFSIIFYLKSLCPVDVPLPGALALLALEADPVPAWLAIPGLLAVSLGILYLAAGRIRRVSGVTNLPLPPVTRRSRFACPWLKRRYSAPDPVTPAVAAASRAAVSGKSA